MTIRSKKLRTDKNSRYHTINNIDLVNGVITVSIENPKSGSARALLLNDNVIKVIRKLRFKAACKYVLYDQELCEFLVLISVILKTVRIIQGEDFTIMTYNLLGLAWSDGRPLYMLNNLGGWVMLGMMNKYTT